MKESSEFGVRDKYEAQNASQSVQTFRGSSSNFTDLQFLPERWVSFFPICCQHSGQWCVIYHCGRRRFARRRVPAPKIMHHDGPAKPPRSGYNNVHALMYFARERAFEYTHTDGHLDPMDETGLHVLGSVQLWRKVETH